MNEEEALLSYLVLQKQLTEEQALFCLEESFRDKGTLLEILTQQKLISQNQIQNSQQWLQKTLYASASFAEESQDIVDERVLLLQKLEQISKKNSKPSTSKTLAFLAPSENSDTTIAPASYSPSVIFPENSVPFTDNLSSNERYHLLENLGEGGMGVVQRVYDRWLEREVALKKIKVKEGSTAPLSKKQTALLWRLTREASITAILEHPNIVPLYDMQRGTHGETYFTMRKIEGNTLRELLRKVEKEPSPLEDANRFLAIFLKVCDAVSYAHAKGIIHRDLKPENIMVGEFGEVYVMDWGIAKKQFESKEKEPSLEELQEKTKILNQTIGGLGTEGYMAPEQRENASQVLPTADIYALGKILRECFTRKSPLEELWFYMQKQSKKHPLEKKASALQKPFSIIPKDIEAIVTKATQEKPQDRYESVPALAKDVSCYLGNFQVSARSYPWSEQLLKWGERNWKALTLTFLVLLLCLGVGVLATWWKKEEAIQARLNEELARKEAEQRQKEAEIAQQEATSAKKEVEHRFILSRIQNLIASAQSCLEQEQDESSALLALQAYTLNARHQGPFHLLLDLLFRRLLAKKNFRYSLLGDSASLFSSRFSPDGKWVAYGGIDGILHIWNQTKLHLEPLALPLPQKVPIRFLQFSPNAQWIAVGTHDGEIYLYRLSDLMHPPIYLKEHQSPVNAVLFTPDSRYLISGSGLQYSVVAPELPKEKGMQRNSSALDNALLIWDLQQIYLGSFHLGGHKKAITSLVYHPKRQWIFSAGRDHTIQIWDYPTLRPGNKIRPIQNWVWFEKHSHQPNILALSPEGRFLASGGYSGEILVWDLDSSFKEPVVLSGHQKPITSLCFSLDSSRLISGSSDQSIRFWDLPSHQEIEWERISAKRNVIDLSLSPSGKVLVGATDRELSFWEIPANHPNTLIAGIGSVNALSFQSQKEYLIAASGAKLYFWNLKRFSAKPIDFSTSHDYVLALAVSPDGSELVCAGKDLGTGEPQISRTGLKSIVFSLIQGGHKNGITALAYHPKLPQMASLDTEGTLCLWDLNQMETPKKTFQKEKQIEFPTFSLSFSGDGHYLAAAGGGYVQIWNLDTEETFLLKGVHHNIIFAAFHPRKLALAACSWDGEVEYWNHILDPEPLLFGTGTKDILTALAFHPKQEYLAVGDVGGKISLWDLAHLKKPIGIISAHQANVNRLLFNPEGSILFSAGKDGQLRYWEFSLADLCGAVQKKVTRNLSFLEWKQYLEEDFPYEILCPQAPIHPSMAEILNQETKSPEELIALFHSEAHPEARKKIDEWQRQKKENEMASQKKWSERWSQSLQQELLPMIWQDPQSLSKVESSAEWMTFLAELQQFTESKIDLPQTFEFIRFQQVCQDTIVAARLLLWEEKYTEAKQLLEEMLQSNPSFSFDLEKDFAYWAAQIHVLRGLRFAEQGEITVALKEFEKAQKFDAEAITANDWGDLCLLGMFYDQAEKVLFASDLALAKNSKNPLFWEIQGLAKLSSGNFKEAISGFEKFLELVSQEDSSLFKLSPNNKKWITYLKAGMNPFIGGEENFKEVCAFLISH